MRFLQLTGLVAVLAAVVPSAALAGDPENPEVVVREPDGDLEVKDSTEVDPADRVLGPEHDFRDRRRVVILDDGDLDVVDATTLPRNDPRIVVYRSGVFGRYDQGRWVTWNGVRPGLRVTTTRTVVTHPVVTTPPVVQAPVRQIPLDPDEDPNDGMLLDTDGDGVYG